MVLMTKKKFLFFLSILYSVYFHFKTFFLNISPKYFSSVNFDDFVKTNNSLWDQKKNTVIKKHNILLTNFVHQPVYTFTEAMISKYVEEFYNYNIYGLIDKHDVFGKELIKSFNIDNFFYITKINFFQRIFLLFQSYKIINKTKNIDEFINFSIENINFGRCIYDHIIRNTGICSFNKFNLKCYFFLSEALFINNSIKKIFSENNFKYMVMSETQFLPSNIIFQNALKNNIKVISRKHGPKKIGVKLVNSILEKFESNHKISNSLVDKISLEDKSLYAKKGLDLINNIFDGKSKHYDSFSSQTFLRKNDRNKDDLYKHFNWDKSKKICTVFSHNLIDGNYNNKWRIFRDNLTWLKETLFYIKSLKKEVNWIIKEHPSEYGLGKSSTSTFREINKIIVNESNIKFYPNDFNTSIIKEITGCVLTSQGSAGLEYPCLGIPSVIAGDSYYQGSGFTIEPRDKNEYFDTLKNMKKIIINELTKDQVSSARILAYVFLEKSRINHSLLYEADISKKINYNNFFDITKNLIFQYKEDDDLFKKLLKIQLDKNNQHLFKLN